jgi:tetratricopeptide (TPR) repeat protein
MKLVSSLALGAALMLGAAPQVAMAAKEKPVEAPKMTLSKEFRAAAGPAQAAIKANAAGADAAVAAAEAAATTSDDKFVAAQLRLQVASALKDQAMQQRAVLAMLGSGSALATVDAPKLNFYAGQFAYQANDFPRAIQYLTEADRLGYKPGNQDVYLLIAEANFKANNIPAGLTFVEKAVAASTAAGTKPPEAWYARASSVAYKAKMNSESAKWTREQVRAYPTKDNWRTALVVYRDGATRDGNLNLDIFRLMRLTKSLAGERDYYEFASLATERGLPGEAKSIIDEGMATSAVPANSRALTELRTMANAKVASDQASLAAAERQAGTSATGRIASATADAYLGYGQDAKAIALYRTALTKGGVDVDAVNTRMGIALLRSGDKAGARTAFTSVKGARADIAAFWLLWLDQMV